MAFISSSNTSSGKGEVPTASVPTACSQVSTVSTEVAAASLSHDTICAYIATQSSGFGRRLVRRLPFKDLIVLRSQDRGKRESYRKDPKVEEPAPKALMAINGIGWDWSYMSNEDENHALVADDVVPTEFALMVMSKLRQ
ncbi:hypothetical protein Tco_0251968 [Tanacetum coccineum]